MQLLSLPFYLQRKHVTWSPNVFKMILELLINISIDSMAIHLPIHEPGGGAKTKVSESLKSEGFVTGTVIVCSTLYGSLSSSCWHISLWIKSMYRTTDRMIVPLFEQWTTGKLPEFTHNLLPVPMLHVFPCLAMVIKGNKYSWLLR